MWRRWEIDLPNDNTGSGRLDVWLAYEDRRIRMALVTFGPVTRTPESGHEYNESQDLYLDNADDELLPVGPPTWWSPRAAGHAPEPLPEN